MGIFINFALFTAVENGYGNSFMYNLGLQFFSPFLQMSLQQRLNLLRLEVGLIVVAEKLSLVFYPALGL